MSHHCSQMSHNCSQQWATTAPKWATTAIKMSHHWSQQWATTAPQWATTAPKWATTARSNEPLLLPNEPPLLPNVSPLLPTAPYTTVLVLDFMGYDFPPTNYVAKIMIVLQNVEFLTVFTHLEYIHLSSFSYYLRAFKKLFPQQLASNQKYSLVTGNHSWFFLYPSEYGQLWASFCLTLPQFCSKRAQQVGLLHHQLTWWVQTVYHFDDFLYTYLLPFKPWTHYVVLCVCPLEETLGLCKFILGEKKWKYLFATVGEFKIYRSFRLCSSSDIRATDLILVPLESLGPQLSEYESSQWKIILSTPFIRDCILKHQASSAGVSLN
jgi:hypothetical protein